MINSLSRLCQKLAAISSLSLICCLASCQGATPPVASKGSNPANCPAPPPSPPAFKVEYEGDFYENLQSRKIIATADTITFESGKYDFTFCRGNNTWSVQPGTRKSEAGQSQDYAAELAKLANPPYQNLDLEGKTYQYRVLLEPNPFPNWQVEPQRVIFALIAPNQQQPQRQVLYTLEQVKQKQAGIQLGVPQITAAVAHGGQLFWSIAPEQGEGNGGIGTIVSYSPKTGKISAIQPPELAKQQLMALTVAGEGENLTLWLTAQQSGEGNPYLPSLGLVAYRPNSGAIAVYGAGNSPLVGAIPNQLQLEGEWLWVGTGNGICRLKWQEANNPQSWNCWRFALMAKLPPEGVPLYPSLFSQEAAAKLTPMEGEAVEVLWWSPTQEQPRQGRYEVKYDQGFTAKLDEGITPWSEYSPGFPPPPWEPPFFWAGRDWYWRGDRFVRPFDAVSLNQFGGGPSGIGSGQIRNGIRPETKAMRGDLDLLQLTKTSTEVKYYSAWVADNLLAPYLILVPQQLPGTVKPNPLP